MIIFRKKDEFLGVQKESQVQEWFDLDFGGLGG